MQAQRRVLIGTPAHDGRVDVWYAHSLQETVKSCIAVGVHIQAVFMSYDSLVQRARNDLVKLALEHTFDDLIFIDSDQAWHSGWIPRLLDHPVQVVGGAVVKKDDIEHYNVKALHHLDIDQETGLTKVDGLGTGFLRLSKEALQKLWAVSPEYSNNGTSCRMVFDVQVVDGELMSEDIVMCRKLKELDIPVYLDTTMTCSHIGPKVWHGNFSKWYSQLSKGPTYKGQE